MTQSPIQMTRAGRYVASATEEDGESDEEQHAWARRQEHRMMKHLTNIVTHGLTEVKQDIAQIKLQVNMAVATADEALDKTRELSVKLGAFDEQRVTLEAVSQKIEEAIQKLKVELEVRPRQLSTAVSGYSRHDHNSDEMEKLALAMVVGSFAQNSERNVVKALIEKHVIAEADETVEEIFAYAFGSIGFVRFKTTDHMKEFLKKFGTSTKPKINGKNLWTIATKSPDERKKAKHIGKYKRVLIEVGLASADDIKIDYRRGVLMVKRLRVGEWKGEGAEGQLELNEEHLKKVGIETVLQNAVTELLSQ